MSEELWARGMRDDVRDVQKLLDFIRKEILTLEFVQGVDKDVEPELRAHLRTYYATIRQIEEATAKMKGG